MPEETLDSLPVPPADNPEREEALGNLCSYVSTLLSKNDTTELDALHDVGSSILNAASQDLYGPDVTKEVAKRLNTYRQKIQFSIRFATAYDDSGLDELRANRTHQGNPYVWSVTHVRLLLRVKDVGQREALARECAAEDWPCRKLNEEVVKITGLSNTGARNVNINSLVKQLSVLSNTWLDFVTLMAQPGSNLYDRIQAAEGSLSESSKSSIRTLCQQFPQFTEKVCEVNGYLSQIQLP